MFAIRKAARRLTSNMDKLLKVTEEFYVELHHSDIQSKTEERTEITQMPAVTREEI